MIKLIYNLVMTMKTQSFNNRIDAFVMMDSKTGKIVNVKQRNPTMPFMGVPMNKKSKR